MRVYHYKHYPYVIFKRHELLQEFYRRPLRTKKSKVEKEMFEYNNAIVNKMLRHKYPEHMEMLSKKRYRRYNYINNLLSGFFYDCLYEPLCRVYKEGVVLKIRNYHIERNKVGVDEDYIRRKKIASAIIKKEASKNIYLKDRVKDNYNDIAKRKFSNRYCILLKNILNSDFVVQFIVDFRYGKRKHDKVHHVSERNGEAK